MQGHLLSAWIEFPETRYFPFDLRDDAGAHFGLMVFDFTESQDMILPQIEKIDLKTLILREMFSGKKSS